jgi:hypothetical protein
LRGIQDNLADNQAGIFLVLGGEDVPDGAVLESAARTPDL